MIPKLYKANETQFKTNGLGALSDCISCVVTEEVNGAYELEMEYPVSGIHYGLIKNGRLILAKPNETSEEQPFIIKEVTASMSGMTVTVYAQHIRYLLNGIPVNPFMATGIANALKGLVSNSQIKTNFTTWTDIENATTVFTVSSPSSFGSLLGGSDGSILDVFSGSTSYAYEFDRFLIKLWKNRGADNGVSIRYAKNLTGCDMESSIESTYTGVLAYYQNEDTNVQGEIQYVENHDKYPQENIYLYDCSNEFDDVPTVDDLNNKAASYIKSNNVGEPSVTIGVNFVPLWQTEEYKDVAPLERVSLCDTVTVVFDELGVNASAKVNKTKYNVLNERYDEITLGNLKSNMASTIKQVAKEQSEETEKVINSKVSQAIEDAVDKIRGGTDGHVVLKANANGETNELYAYDGDSLESASKVLRLNYEGIAGTDKGINGPYNIAITTDGQINANCITVGELDGAYIKANSITADKINLTFGDTTTMTLGGDSTGALFNGQGTFKLNSVGDFQFNNYADSSYSRLKNFIKTNTFKSGDYYRQGLWLYNYQYGSTNLANYLFMIGQENYSGTGFYNYALGSTVTSNNLTMSTYSTQNNFELVNRTLDGKVSNYIGEHTNISGAGNISINNRRNDDADKLGNRIFLEKGSTAFNLFVENYQLDNTNLANELYLHAESSNNNLRLLNKKLNSTNWANTLFLEAKSSVNSIYLENYRPSTNYKGNQIWSYTEASWNWFKISNCDFSGNVYNAITMSYHSDGTDQSSNYVSITNSQNCKFEMNGNQNISIEGPNAVVLSGLTNGHITIQTYGVKKACRWVQIGNYYCLTGENV